MPFFASAEGHTANATSKYPACAIDEYASNRFTLSCTRAAMLPMVMDSGNNPDEPYTPRRMSLEHDPQKHRENRRLRRGGHERNHGRRRALVNVRRPDVEWRCRNFECEADKHQRHTDVSQHGTVSQFKLAQSLAYRRDAC